MDVTGFRYGRQYLMSEKTNRLAYLLDTITYKPGWKFQALDREYGSSMWQETVLAILWDAPDAVTGRNGKFARYQIVPDYLLTDGGQEHLLLRYIEHEVIAAEIHEVHEFLRVNGIPVTDPHPERREKAGD